MSIVQDLRQALDRRSLSARDEGVRAVSLQQALEGQLRAVEAAFAGDLLTSVLLVDAEGGRLLHGAAPTLPTAYCEAIHGIEIGPGVGSCGTAAYLGHAVYVTDIATDPLWTNFRDLALAHGLRACWSTPILDRAGKVIATFAIYHRTPRGPTAEEQEVIQLISGHVADAITGDLAAH